MSRTAHSRRSRVIGLLALLLSTGASAAEPEEAASFKAAFTGAKPQLAVRYRLESVSDDAFGEDALASTLRTALSYETLVYRGFVLFLEAEDVSVVGSADRFNNAGAGALGNGVRGRPVVADVDGTEMNQAYVAYSRPGFSARLGRQEINLGDQRFVGAVGWRQNHQSFDALTLTTDRLPKTKLSYSYVDRAGRIFGDGKPMSSHLLGAAIEAGKVGKLRLYGYLVDYDLLADAGLSTATLGAEWTGEVALGGGSKLSWELELARQSDFGDNPSDLEAPYVHLQAGIARSKLRFAAGWELLDSDPGSGRFTTPLATLHKFNGWADKFLSTPSNGLEDLYLEAGASAGAWSCLARYHRFSAAVDGSDYGSEVDLLISWSAPWKQTFAAKAALYAADELGTDTQKLMVWTAYRF